MAADPLRELTLGPYDTQTLRRDHQQPAAVTGDIELERVYVEAWSGYRHGDRCRCWPSRLNRLWREFGGDGHHLWRSTPISIRRDRGFDPPGEAVRMAFIIAPSATG